MTVAAGLLVLLRFLLIRENNRAAILENENQQLSAKQIARLERTVAVEGITLAEARLLQKGYRYPL